MFQKYPLVRVRQFINNPPFAWFWINRLLFYKKSSFQYADKIQQIKQLTAPETLADLIKNNRSIIRFGDGEFGQYSGAGIFQPNSDWSQKYSPELKCELERQLSLQNPKICIAIPPVSHMLYKEGDIPELDVIPSMHTEARMYVWQYIHKDQVYGDWSIFMPHLHTEFDWTALQNYIADKTVVVVTGGTEKLKNLHLGARTLFVECGKHDAFSRRGDIQKDIDELIKKEDLYKEKTLFWVSLGCTAGCIVEHLSAEGFVAWDTGHMFRYAAKQLAEL